MGLRWDRWPLSKCPPCKTGTKVTGDRTFHTATSNHKHNNHKKVESSRLSSHHSNPRCRRLLPASR